MRPAWRSAVRPDLPSAQPLQRRRDRVAGRRGLLGDRLGEQPELVAQGVDLVDQGDHRLDGVIVEADIVGELGEQAHARHVDLLEAPGIAVATWPQQAARHPALDMDGGELAVQAQQFVEIGHVNCSIAWRGSWALPSSHESRKAFSLSSGSSGSTTFSFAYWSPRWPDLRSSRPRPLSLSVVPVLEPAGTFSMTAPPTVGTLILPPSTAS